MTECKCEKVLPYDNQRGKTEQVEQMFDNIAGDYDPMNRMMSLFNDRDWRKKALLTLTSTSRSGCSTSPPVPPILPSALTNSWNRKR